MEKKRSLFSMIMQYAEQYKSKYVCSVVLAVISVVCGMVPYFAVAKMVTAMISHEERDISFFVLWCIAAAAGYIAKGIFNGLSTSISHTATYLTIPAVKGVDSMEIYRDKKIITVWMTNKEQELYDRKQLTARLLKNVDDPKCKVIFFLSGKGDLFENTEGVLLANLAKV